MGGLGQYYGGARACCYQDMSIVLIEQLEMGNMSLLAKREQYWQNQLRAFVENGEMHSVSEKTLQSEIHLYLKKITQQKQ